MGEQHSGTERVDDVQEVEDLDVPESESDDVKGGRRIGGIKGESKDAKHPTEIDL